MASPPPASPSPIPVAARELRTIAVVAALVSGCDQPVQFPTSGIASPKRHHVQRKKDAPGPNKTEAKPAAAPVLAAQSPPPPPVAVEPEVSVNHHCVGMQAIRSDGQTIAITESLSVGGGDDYAGLRLLSAWNGVTAAFFPGRDNSQRAINRLSKRWLPIPEPSEPVVEVLGGDQWLPLPDDLTAEGGSLFRETSAADGVVVRIEFTTREERRSYRRVVVEVDGEPALAVKVPQAWEAGDRKCGVGRRLRVIGIRREFGVVLLAHRQMGFTHRCDGVYGLTTYRLLRFKSAPSATPPSAFPLCPAISEPPEQAILPPDPDASVEPFFERRQKAPLCNLDVPAVRADGKQVAVWDDAPALAGSAGGLHLLSADTAVTLKRFGRQNLYYGSNTQSICKSLQRHQWSPMVVMGYQYGDYSQAVSTTQGGVSVAIESPTSGADRRAKRLLVEVESKRVATVDLTAWDAPRCKEGVRALRVLGIHREQRIVLLADRCDDGSRRTRYRTVRWPAP